MRKVEVVVNTIIFFWKSLVGGIRGRGILMARSHQKLHIFQRRAANKDVYITYISTTNAQQGL